MNHSSLVGAQGRMSGLLVVGTMLAALILPAADGSTVEVDLQSDSDAVRIDAERIGDATGRRMAVCDINGDGIDDLVLGASDADGPDDTRVSAGDVYVLYGRRGEWTGPTNIVNEKDVTIYGEQPYDLLGDSVGCGDVNGDGYSDIVMCAIGGDGPFDSRPNAGQAHILMGGADLRSEIDLATYDTPVVYGEKGNYSGFCEHPRVGDLDGDGIGDVVVDDGAREEPEGTQVDYGRVYILFGRSSWPSEIDLRGDADVIIYGRESGDSFGGRLEVGDLDRDGTSDLVVTGHWGDGPDNGRRDCGEVFVFRGRPVWPSQIDLRTEDPEMYVFGPDPYDSVSSTEGIAISNLDGDAFRELVLGIGMADGRDNSKGMAGEARLFEPGTGWPATVDLATDFDSVIYGRDVKDRYAAFLRAGDVNGDGWDDLAGCSAYGDGPDNAREGAGESAVVMGREPFPVELDLAQGDADVMVYGAAPGDYSCSQALPDLNGDGLREVVLSSRLGGSQLAAIWIVSPFDADGDGVTQLPDNCPLVANPDQADSDGDLVGDACQGDYDGDGQSDAQDCAPGNAAAGTPGQVVGLMLTGGAVTTLNWQATVFADVYDISRGTWLGLGGSDYGACQSDRDSDPTDTTFEDAEMPVVGDGFFYLVRGRNLTCPAAGSWGSDSSGAERVNTNPLGCGDPG